MTYFNALQKLLPPVSYDRNGNALTGDLTPEANVLDNVQRHAQKVLNGITPFYADELLEDWERVLGLTSNPDDLYQERLEKVLQKLAEIGGLSIPYFIGLAEKLGYEITIFEAEPEVFRAGRNRAGDSLGLLGLMWVWRVNIHSVYKKVFFFRAGLSRAGDRLSKYTDPVIETIFNDLKPAFTLCVFSYEEK